MKNLYPFLCLLFFFSCEGEEKKFDRVNPQKPILTYSAIDSVLNTFETISYNDLPAHYLEYSDPQREYESKLKQKTYYQIKGDQIFLYLVGTHRVEEFLTHDQYYEDNLDDLAKNRTQYLLIEKQELYFLLDFINALEENELNPDGFRIKCAHRHPTNNYVTGGASQSQHMFGNAIDIAVKDINNDKKVTQKDKEIALEIVEDIIGSKGGVGRYPGTMSIHFDCRGYRARWDSYTPANQKK